jgi:hypothetical protein
MQKELAATIREFFSLGPGKRMGLFHAQIGAVSG